MRKIALTSSMVFALVFVMGCEAEKKPAEVTPEQRKSVEDGMGKYMKKSDEKKAADAKADDKKPAEPAKK